MGNFDLWPLVWVAVGFFVQQFANWLVKDWLDRHKDQIRRATNRKLLIVLLDLAAVIWLVWMAFEVFNNTKPAVRQDILVAIGMQTMLVIVFANLIDDLHQWVKAIRAQAAPEHPKA